MGRKVVIKGSASRGLCRGHRVTYVNGSSLLGEAGPAFAVTLNQNLSISIT